MAGKVKLTEARRTVVAEFYRPPHGTTRIHSLVVIEEKRWPSGETYTSRDLYDVDWSRRYGYIFNLSGGGGSGPVKVHGLHHVAGEVELVPEKCTWCEGRRKRGLKSRTRLIRKINRTRRLQSLPRGIELQPGQDLLDFLEFNGIQQDSVYCSVCRDYLPGDDCNLCEHIWWCNKTGWYSTPGDRCECKGLEECDA